MIKVYRYNDNKSTASHVLQGKNGMTVRYNFERGNVLTKQKPEIILRNKFAQDLLEASELFKSGLVTLVRATAEPSDVIDDAPATQTQKSQAKEEVKGIRTTDEVIAYVNDRFDKDCKTLATAMKHASKAGIVFPDYNPD